MREMDFNQWMEKAEKAEYRAARLAKCLNVCRKQLERRTKTHFGQSPQKWLDEQRLNKAVELLKNGQRIKEVLNQLGFKQFSHFSRSFKSQHGLSPKHFVLWWKSEKPFTVTVKTRERKWPGIFQN